MRASLLFAFFVACAQPPTTLFLSLHSTLAMPPTSLAVSIWDPHGALVLGQTARGKIPGTLLITNLPDVDQRLRFAFADNDTNAPLAALAIDVRAHQQTSANVDLNGAGDSDSDGVPDAVDDCPHDANREQRDSDGDGVGDACAGRDLGPQLAVDLAGADLRPAVCNALFCDDFETDVIPNTSQVTTAGGMPLWQIDGEDEPRANTEIDFTSGALGTGKSIRFRLVPDLTDGGTVMTYQRLSPGIVLYPGIPNLTKILTGPTYVRFFVKMDRAPTDFYSPEVTLAYVYWGADLTNNVELQGTTSGIAFNDRYTFTTNNDQENPVAVNWVSDWVCVEWKHELVPGDGGATDYHSQVWINGTPAGTFDGSGADAVFGGFILGSDVEFRSDIPNTTGFVEQFDEVKISDQPIGCN